MKTYLLSPGPTPIPPDVSEALAAPILHHRMPVFVELLKGVVEDLKWLMMTKNDVITMATTATGAMDAAVSNFLHKGATAITIAGGKFGQRWSEIVEAYGLNDVRLDVEWGKPVTIEQIDQAFKEHPDAIALYATASETSTGVAHPIKEIGEYLKKNHPEVLFVVDAVTALGIFEVRTDDWGIDILVGGSQKGLMLPPGLAVMSISEKAWEFNKKSDLPRYYLDVAKEAKAHKKGQTAYTSAVSHIMGLRKSLDMFKKEGLDNVFTRFQALAHGVRQAAVDMGLELFAPESPSPSITSIKAPEGINGQDIVKKLSERGITIAGGQAQLKGKIFRIGHMGYMDEGDMLVTLLNLEEVLTELGFKVPVGAGVAGFAKGRASYLASLNK